MRAVRRVLAGFAVVSGGRSPVRLVALVRVRKGGALLVLAVTFVPRRHIGDDGRCRVRCAPGRGDARSDAGGKIGDGAEREHITRSTGV